MNPDGEEADVFSDTDNPNPLRAGEEEGDEEGAEEEEEDEEEDARIFNAWMHRYKGGEQQQKIGEEAGEESEVGRPESRCSIEPPVRMRADRRASLPCSVRGPATQHHSSKFKLQSVSGEA